MKNINLAIVVLLLGMMVASASETKMKDAYENNATETVTITVINLATNAPPQSDALRIAEIKARHEKYLFDNIVSAVVFIFIFGLFAFLIVKTKS